MAEKADGSNGTIMPFVTSDDSRCDNETCWLLEVRSLTNPPDLVISSPMTKGSVIPQAKWRLSSEDSQGRTNAEMDNRLRFGAGSNLTTRALRLQLQL